MITHGNKQISGIIYSRKASDGGGAVALTNIIRGPQVVFGGLKPFYVGWLTYAARDAILAAFGQTDGKAVINATNAYLTQLAASDRDKAQALAALLNEDPMMVCSLGLQPELTVLPKMPMRLLNNSNEAYIQLDFVVGYDDEIFIEFLTDASNHPATICGAGNSTWSDGTSNITKATDNGYYCMFCGASGEPNKWYGDGIVKGLVNKSKLQMWLNGEQKINLSATPTSLTTYKFTLFGNARGSNTNIATHYNGSIYRFYIKRNGEYVYELYPYMRNNQIGFINVINDTMETKTGGTGTLSYKYGYWYNGSWVTWTPPTP